MVDACGVAHTALCFQVTTLEQETMEVLSLVLSMKNTFTPINRIPPEALSLIPDHWGHQAEKDIIGLTHICHGWREIFTSHSLLWTHLDCKNTEKTRVYIERSKIQPLEISLTQSKSISYSDNALLMAAPYTNRLSSLTIRILSNTLSRLPDHFPFPAPLLNLKELKIVLDANSPSHAPAILNAIFPDHLSPLRMLSLSNVVTDLPWRNLSNLTMLEFRHVRRYTVDPLFMGKLLDFFESAPLLRKITLHDSIPNSSTVSPGRVISLLNLENLAVGNLPAHSTFLDHLSIPRCALLNLRFSFSEGNPTTPLCFTNFGNFDITTINLLVDKHPWTRMRLNGPSGVLRMCSIQKNWSTPSLLQSLSKFDLSKARRLSVAAHHFSSSGYRIQVTFIFHTLLLMNNLRTLTLIEGHDLPFIQALNPEENESHTVPCPKLEELVVYIWSQHCLCPGKLIEIARNRAMRFSKLSSITIIDLGKDYDKSHKETILELRKYVSRVEFRLDVSPPDWDAVFGDRGDDEHDDEL